MGRGHFFHDPGGPGPGQEVVEQGRTQYRVGLEARGHSEQSHYKRGLTSASQVGKVLSNNALWSFARAPPSLHPSVQESFPQTFCFPL